MRKYTTCLIVSFIAEIVLILCAYAEALNADGTQPSSGIFWLLAIVMGIVFGLLFYFLPYAIAKNRKVENCTAVFLVNLLLGWCLIGWAAALIMGCVMKTELQAQIEREVYASVRSLKG